MKRSRFPFRHPCLRCTVMGGLLALLLPLTGCQSSSTHGPERAKHATHDDGKSRPSAPANRRAFGVTAEAPLKLPARIGIARIAGGAIVDIPPSELRAWEIMNDRLAPALGELVPINRIVVGLAAPPPASVNNGPTMVQHIVNCLRQTGARQRVDAVLIYEVALAAETNTTPWTLLDLTGIAAVLGTSRSHATSHASAVLVDVRNGAVCGSAIATSADEIAAGPYAVFEEKKYDQRERVTGRATFALVPQIETLITRSATSDEFADVRPFPEWREQPAPASSTNAPVPSPRPRPTAAESSPAVRVDEGAAQDFWGR